MQNHPANNRDRCCESSWEASDTEIRCNVRAALEEMRESVVACGYRWDGSGRFLAIIDEVIKRTENSGFETMVIVTTASKLLCLHTNFLLFDEGEISL
ncbi:MAG: hypothetical protein D4R65_11890 [Verrucomicrobiaceae bacterium]|nr:MAG: hypothetical protein D4R65_11890 [Verrucomicrobiaceae bacterium]